MHLNSCDLLCADPKRWVADLHGHWQGADPEVRTATLALVVWSGAVCLVHATLADFHQTSGAPRKELASLLAALSGVSSRGSIVLLRDTPADGFAPRQKAVEVALLPLGVLAVIPVDDFRGLRSAARRAGAGERLSQRLEELLAKAEGAGTPCLEELQRIHQALAEQGSSVATAAPAKALGEPRRSALGEELCRLLDSAQRSGEVSSVLFPMSVISRQLVACRRLDGGGGATAGISLELPSARGGGSSLEPQREWKRSSYWCEECHPV